MRSVSIAILRALLNAPGLSGQGIHFYGSDTEVTSEGEVSPVPQMKLPWIAIISMPEEPLMGSAQYSTFTPVIVIATQADDAVGSDAATKAHAARVSAVQKRMAETAVLKQFFATVGTVALMGPAVAGQNDPGVEASAFHTPLTYSLGVKKL